VVKGQSAAPSEACESCLLLGFFPDPSVALIGEKGSKLLRMDLATGKKTPVLEAPAGMIDHPALSPDGRWVSLLLDKPDGRVALFIVPLTGTLTPKKDWIPIFEEGRYLGSPAWSPDGNSLYFLSQRDGFCCVWRQKLEPRSKKPVGDAQGVYHAHRTRFALNLPLGNGALAVARNKLALWMSESTGNIYLAAPKAR
jgi:hypothetical protein